jgi:tetratricopeptide (TPR) repeat protein
VAESIWYGQNATLIDAVLQAVKFDGKKAEQMIREIAKKAPNPVPLAVLAARRLVKNDMLDSAQKILQMILEKDDRCVPALSELGKILHMNGEHHAALDVLRAATKLSPHNIKRLCLLGEVELNLNDPESARLFFAKALVIDPESEMAHAGMVVADNLDEFVPASSASNVPRNFASLMNTMGITFVRNGQFSKGIEQYQSAMYFLEKNEDNAKVAFNLGLGFLRWGKPKDALPWFRKSEQLVGDGQSKSAGYVQLLLKKMGVKSKGPSGSFVTDRGKVADFNKVARTAKQVNYASEDEGGRIDTTAFEQASLHLSGDRENRDGDVGRDGDHSADADSLDNLAEINETALQELDEAS